MDLKKRELIEILFQKYLRQYAQYFTALTQSHDICVDKIELYRKGRKLDPTADRLWEAFHLTYGGKTDQISCGNTIITPTEDLVAPFLQIYDALPDTRYCAINGNKMERISYNNPFAANNNVSLNLECKFEEKRGFDGPPKYAFSLAVNSIERKRKETTISQTIARADYNEELGKQTFLTDKFKVHQESIGAIQGFLREMDAVYRLSEPIPRDVYDLLDRCAKILKES